jgi:hypothetical protein
VKVAGSGSEWPGDIRFDPFATNLFALQRTPLCAKSGLCSAAEDARGCSAVFDRPRLRALASPR